jgi:hypothetical protein
VTDLRATLEEFYRDKLASVLRHQAGARLIAQYDANNTYQYIIGREDVQLAWLAQAIAELGGTLSSPTSAPTTAASEPVRAPDGKAADVANAIIDEDVREAQAFVARWRPRVDGLTNARHRGMLRVILGETLEQKRFFDQAREGRTDLLGRRGASLGPAKGDVLSSRWIE